MNLYKKLTNYLLPGQIKKNIYTALLTLLSFTIPVAIALFIFYANDFSLFGGERTMLMADAQSEYISYFRTLKYIYQGNDSLVYTMSKAYGGNFLSTYCFYLSSPFNYFVVFVPDEAIPSFMLLISIIKMGLSSLNMYLFLRFYHHKNSNLHLIFAISYGLCSYSFIYLSNLMWIDGVMILPLVILGIHHIFERQKIILLYPLSLMYALMTSWYIGFMICIFSVIYFLFTFAGKKKKEFVTQRRRLLLEYTILSLVGGFLAAGYWFASFLHFSGTKAGGFNFPQIGEFLNISTVLSGFLTNNYTTSKDILRYGNFVFFFTSIPVLVYFILYFFSKKYPLRQRLCSLLMISFYFLAGFWGVLDTLMHGGAIPTWFPFRYGFVVCFIIVYLASKAHEGIQEVNIYGYISALIAPVVVLLIVSYLPTDLEVTYQFSLPALITYIVTYILLLALYILRKLHVPNLKFTYSLLGLILIPLTSYSAFLGENQVIESNINDNVFQSQEVYEQDMVYQEDFDKIKEYDDSFYRMENTFLRPGSYNSTDNDPTFYQYYGISHYSSTEYKDVMQYNQKLGFHYNHFFEGYDYGSTLAMNSYLGIKYILSDGSRNISFLDDLDQLDIASNNNITFYQNPYVLPLAFLTEKHNASYVNEGVRNRETNRVRWFNHFEYQNEIYHSMKGDIKEENGERKDIYHPIIPTSYTLSHGMTYSIDEDGYHRYTGIKGSQIKITFTVPEEAYQSNLYFYFMDKNSDLTIRMDNSHYEMMSYWHNGIRTFPDNHNHTHTLSITLKKDMKNTRIREEIYYERLDVLKEYTQALQNQSATKLEKKTSLFSFAVEGDINITSNQNKSLLFTIPYEKGVQLYIDDKKVETLTRFNIFTACDLDDITPGQHKIKFVYHDEGFEKGLIIAGIGLISLVGYQIYFILRRRYLVYR